MTAAEAGLSVVVLEAGDFVTPANMTQREEQMLPRLLWHAGARTTTDRSIRIHQGRGVGGSSLHNLNLVKRIPDPIRKRWANEYGLELPWDELYAHVEQLISVSLIPESMWSAHNRVLARGAAALNWKWGGLSHNRTGCLSSGFCELGCAYDAKNNALKVMVPRIVKAGGEILFHALATHLRHEGGRAVGVDAVALDPVTRQPKGPITLTAPRVCVAGSATHTAALLLRSGAPDASETTGRTLRIHPAVIAAGELADPVRAFEGTPQSVECTEWLDFDSEDKRIWILPAFGHPMGVAAMLPGHGAAHRDWMERYAQMAVLTGMLHDHTKGRVSPDGSFDFSVEYEPIEPDRKQLALGLAKCAQLLFAAGARRVLIPVRQPIVLNEAKECAALEKFEVTPESVELSAVHPMGTAIMGADPKRSVVRTDGRHHQLEGLWVADGSVFPTSIGVPPQLSIYAVGLHVGRAIGKS